MLFHFFGYRRRSEYTIADVMRDECLKMRQRVHFQDDLELNVASLCKAFNDFAQTMRAMGQDQSEFRALRKRYRNA